MWKITNKKTNEFHYWSNNVEDDFLRFIPDNLGLADHSDLKFERSKENENNNLNNWIDEEKEKGNILLIDISQEGVINILSKVVETQAIPPEFDNLGRQISEEVEETFSVKIEKTYELFEVEWPYQEIVKNGKKELKFLGNRIK